ncbi:glycosyltransferase involved in cell wall biosynthesis [Rhodovulum sulfidophilum]|uniref:glycosyltransferase family 2 protein n=1 Tax=Rhodovulum sulfidophilum TaxID=35806 RepID=UPI0006990B00|nr:glycosyltransferase family 2 protein [Rhodovulum sulfidophilum]ANB34412.1 hypothetical protein A6W98_10210 [Rhodovulum sulfidophilum DSM 1374]ANB38235.1 hypothetical protein A6024_10070 [Rhodovulum sulfidophilum]MCW2305464.1 glycosyltransferase involved in cell wall biosynthesis [Rhodovulum sulfidophilum]
MPEVTVLIPARNVADTLEECLTSVLAQDFEDFDVLVVDDESTDETPEILKNIQDRRLKVCRFQSGRGLGDTLNFGFSQIESPLVARMDADDVMPAGRLSSQVAFLRRHPDCGVVGGQIDFMYNDLSRTGPVFPLEHEEIVRDLYLMRFSVCHPAAMIRRDVFDAIGGYHVFGPGQDLDFFIRASEVAQLRNLPEIVHHLRVDLNSYSASKARERLVAYKYALEAARSRSKLGEDIAYLDFVDRAGTSIPLGVEAAFFAASCNMFRKHLIAKLEGRSSKSIYFVLAALSRPVFSARMLKKKLSSETASLKS